LQPRYLLLNSSYWMAGAAVVTILLLGKLQLDSWLPHKTALGLVFPMHHADNGKAAYAANSNTVDYEVIYCINGTGMVTIWPLRSAAAVRIIPATNWKWPRWA